MHIIAILVSKLILVLLYRSWLPTVKLQSNDTIHILLNSKINQNLMCKYLFSPNTTSWVTMLLII